MQTRSKTATTRPKKTPAKTLLEGDSFEAVARRLGATSEAAFNKVLKRVGKATVPDKPKKKAKRVDS